MYNFLATFVNTNGSAFPNTAAVNSSGGGATDGTEFIKAFVDDLWGWMQGLLTYTGDSPSGSAETASVSQLLNSIIKISSNLTELSSNTTHTVEKWNKHSVLVLSSGCTVARLVGGTGTDETNRLIVQNNNTVTVEVDFGASVNQEEIILQPGQWIEFIYDSEDAKFIVQRSNGQIIINTAINYTIGDWVPSGTKILVNCNTAAQYGLITVTLPTMADNIGKWYEVEHGPNQGLIKVDGEGSEKLNYNGTRKDDCIIFSSGMGYKFKNNGTDWTMTGKNILNLGWQKRSTWTNVHLGNGVSYDNGSGTSTKNTDWTGMVITEATSGFTAVVVKDTGGTGTTGILYVYELSSGFTAWTNNRKLTASNNQNIDVNEPTGGSSKNIDYNLYHGFGCSLINLYRDFFIATSLAETGIMSMDYTDITRGSALTSGFTTIGVDTNSFKNQTGSSGFQYIDDTGAPTTISSDDWYYLFVLNFSC